MKSALLGIVTAVLLASTSGCHSIFGYNKSVILTVPEITAPATIAPSTPLSVVLLVQSGGCRRFDRLETAKNESGASIIAWGRDSGGKGVACTADVRHDRVTTQFNPPFSSPFTITVDQGEVLPPVTITVRVE